MRRRDVLKAAAGGAVALFVGGSRTRAQCPPPPSAGGDGWAALDPAVNWPAVDPVTGWNTPTHGSVRGYKVLEIFLVGGCAVWDTFAAHLSPWSQFSAEHEAGTTCGSTSAPDNRVTFRGGWKLGTCLKPLDMALPYNGRPGTPTQLFDHMRILPVMHGQSAHEAAIPLSLTGQTPGSPRLTGPGAAIGRRFGQASRPRGVVIKPRPVQFASITAAQDSAAAVGRLPAWARPLVVDLSTASDLASMLSRDAYLASAWTASTHDAVLATYRSQYRKAAAPPGCSEALRSFGLGAYEAAAGGLNSGVSLASTFGAASVTTRADSNGPPFCKPLSNDAGLSFDDSPAVGVDLAVNLLGDPSGEVRHATVFDTGIIGPTRFGYDTHRHLAETVDNNLYSTASRLAAHIATGTLDLRDTLVVINTEFGRTATIEMNGSNNGRSHRPAASWTVMMGGPTVGPFEWGDFTSGGQGSARGLTSGPGSSMSASAALTPGDVRAAVLAAAGVDPTVTELFETGDLGPQATQGGAMTSSAMIDNLKQAAFRAV